jgi:hypothetical protein
LPKTGAHDALPDLLLAMGLLALLAGSAWRFRERLTASVAGPAGRWHWRR